MTTNSPSCPLRGVESEPLVDFILVAEFDIDTGSTLRHQYPSPVPGYKSDWFAEFMLPEGAHNRELDWTYIFLNRDKSQQDESYWIHPHLPNEKSSDLANRFLYGINLVQTKMDDTVRRGAIVKAMAVFSRYQYLDVFKEPLAVALEEYFTKKSVNVLESFYASLNSVDMSCIPRPNALSRALVAREAVVRKNIDLLISAAYTTAVEFQGRIISVQIPYLRSLDEVSTVHIARLVKVLGVNIMRLFHSILTGQRILFIGYNHSAADISDIVLSTAALVSPPLVDIIRRVFPYASLSDLSFLDTKGYIAGVTNPMFRQMDSKWDLLCTLDLQNETCSLLTADEKRAEDALAKGKSVPQPKHSSSVAGGSEKADEFLMHEGVSLLSHEAGDSIFFTKLNAGISVNKFGENWIRQQFTDLTETILAFAIDQRMDCLSGISSLVEKKKTTGSRPKAKRMSGSPSTNGTLSVDDVTITVSSESVTKDRTQSWEEVAPPAAIERDMIAFDIERAVVFSDKTKQAYLSNIVRSNILAETKMVQAMFPNMWLWVNGFDEVNGASLRKCIRRLSCEVNLDAMSLISLLDVVQRNIISMSDPFAKECFLQALVAQLPPHTDCFDGGIYIFAVCLYNTHPIVKRLSFYILSALKSSPSTSFLFDHMNQMYLNMFNKVSLQVSDGSLQLEEEEQLQNEARAAKLAKEREREAIEAQRAALAAKAKKSEDSIDFRDSTSAASGEISALSLLQPVETIVDDIVKTGMSGLNMIFQAVDAIDEEEQRHYMQTESPMFE